MASPMTDLRSLAPAEGPPPVDLVPTVVRAVVEEIAGAAGAWCHALSPEGDRVAHVADRSGIPRLEVAALDGRTSPAPSRGWPRRR
jgi:hypothetical protein